MQLIGGPVPVLPPQGRFAQQKRNHVDLWVLLLDLGEKSFCSIILLELKSVFGFQDRIKLPQLVFGIGEALLERFGRDCRAKSEVAESAQFFLRVRTQISSTRILAGEGIVGQQCLHLFPKHGDGGGLRGGNVPGFSGIGFKIVQLWLGSFDKVKALTLERVQRTPTERTEGIKSLAVGRIVCSLICGLTPCLIIGQRRTEQSMRLKVYVDRIVRIFHVGQLQKRRGHGRGLHGLATSASRNAAPNRRFHDQRHMHRGVVHEEAMLIFAVLPERLAMIAECDDQRRIIKVVLFEPCHQVTELVIRVGDLAIVEVAAVLGAVGFWRIVGAVRVVKMQPKKKRASRSCLQPLDGMGYTFPSATVHQPDILFLEGFRRKRVIVKVEAARQSPTSVENEGADHGSGGVTRFLEGLRHGTKLLCQRLPGEILHAVLKRISAGQDDRMRRPCKWDLRDCALKHDPVACQRIEGWSLDGLRSITSHVVGAQGIDGDQYDAGTSNVRSRDAGSLNAGPRLRFRLRWLARTSLPESCDSGSQRHHNRELERGKELERKRWEAPEHASIAALAAAARAASPRLPPP